MMKIYQRAVTSAKAATKPKTQVKPSRVDICFREGKQEVKEYVRSSPEPIIVLTINEKIRL